MTPGTTEQAVRRQVADLLAENGMDEHVNVLRVQQRELRDNGFLVDLDVTGISQLYASVNWYYDLGVPSGDSRRKRLTPGRKALIKDTKLRSLETRARRNLEQHSYRIQVFGSYRYIPNDAFLDWWETHQEIVAELGEEKQRIVEEYDDLVRELTEDFERMARETWWSLMGRPDAEDWLRENDIESFAQAVIDTALRQMPSRQDIQTKIRIDLHPATFLLTPEEEADLLEAERIRHQRQEERMEHDFWLREERAHAERAEAKAEAAKEEAAARRMVAHQEAQAEIERMEAKTAAIKAAQLEIAREAVKTMTSPFQETIETLRGQILDTTHEILDNIDKHGRVLGKTSQKIENMVATFKLLNVAGDRELEAALKDLESAMQATGVTYKRDTGLIETALREIAVVAQAEAQDAAQLTELGGWDMLEV